MNTELRTLDENELQSVHGGMHWPPKGVIGIALFILEIPHMLIGVKEFTDYTGSLWNKGCDGLDEDEYFSRGLCGIKNMVTSPFAKSAKEEL